MTAPAYDAIIIGAGFTGTALAIQLTRLLPAGSRLLLLGTPRATGRGLAYGTEVPDHLLNVRAARMSLFPDDANHFCRWLAGEGHESEERIADSYAPRLLYGRYIRDTLQKAVAEADGVVSVDITEGTAVELQKNDNGFTVRDASGRRWAGRIVALCSGNGQPAFPIPAEAIAPAARDRMIADPWSDFRMRTIAADASILFVGTGLTMVDQVLTLLAAGHSGPMTAVSRHGLLPISHLDLRTDPIPVDLPEGKLSLRRLFRTVVEAAKAELAAGRDWRAVIDGLRPLTQDIWRRLDIADQRRFFRHLEAIWSVHRHRTAPVVSRRIGAPQTGGRLTVRAARVLAVKPRARGVTVALRERGSRTVELAAFDWVVNCSGTGKDHAAASMPLVVDALSRGLVRPDALGRGLDVTPECAVIGRNGAPVAGLFALGPATAGVFLETTAVPEIREQCLAVAQRLARHVMAEGPRERITARHYAGLSSSYR